MEKKTVQSNKRKSNIELLRIICTLMVITLHIQNPALLGGVKYARESGSFFNEAITSWLFCMSIIAVDVFILISGYFMINSSKRKLEKVVNSLIEKYTSILTSLGISILTCAVSFVFPKLWGTNGIIAYNSVLVIIQAAAFFNFFIQLDLRYNAVINFLAKASFGVFLLHMAVIRVVSAHFDIHMYFQKGTVSALLCYLALLFSSYIVCMLFDSLARFVMTPVSKLWSQTKLFSYDTGFTLTKKGNS